MTLAVCRTYYGMDDFSREQVPGDKTYGGIHIGMIIVGGVIGIPGFLQAAKVGGSLGLEKAVLAFLAGGFILGSLGALTSYAGTRTRYSTYMLTGFAFGRTGGKIVNFIIALTLVGWYGVIINVFAAAADLVVQSRCGPGVPAWTYIVMGSCLMVGVTLSGFKGIDKLALCLVPVMLIFLLYAAWLSWDDVQSWSRGNPGAPSMSYSTAISSVVGGYIVGVVIQPDYSRFAKNVRHAMWAVFIALWVVQTLVFFLAAVPSVATGVSNLIRIMVTLGIGVPAFLLLLLGSWCSNVLCLYSSGLSLATIFMRARLWQLLLAIGVAGTALAFMYTDEYLIPFLVLLGVTVPPIASIYVLDVVLIRRGETGMNPADIEPGINVNAFIAWGAAILVGYLAETERFSISSIASLDSIITATVLYYGLTALSDRRPRIIRRSTPTPVR